MSASSLRRAVETGLVRALLAITRILPRGAVLALGSCAGGLAWLLDGRHRRIAAENLRLCYGPDVPPAFVRRTVARCFRHFGRITLDSLCLFQRPYAELAPLVTYEGLEHLEQAYAAGRGVLLFTGHFGHWELTGLMQGYRGFPLAVVARPLDNPGLELELLRLRGRSGNRVLYKRSAVREMLRALGASIGVAIVIDQDARADGVFVPFFGRPASTTPTLALLALRTGAPVLPSFSVPRPDGTYHVVYEPPVAIERTGDRERDVLELTARCTAIVERWVRRHPEAWLWMHRRFKTRPAC
jgi:KDO2-lipid IV(A) lauroyltransferase